MKGCRLCCSAINAREPLPEWVKRGHDPFVRCRSEPVMDLPPQWAKGANAPDGLGHVDAIQNGSVERYVGRALLANACLWLARFPRAGLSPPSAASCSSFTGSEMFCFALRAFGAFPAQYPSGERCALAHSISIYFCLGPEAPAAVTLSRAVVVTTLSFSISV